MAVRISAAGSVGTVSPQFVDLSEPLTLECGKTLFPVRIAYETYGKLSAAKDNVILVCHALSGDAHAAGWTTETGIHSALDGFKADDGNVAKKGLGWWDKLIGPGKAFDTDRYFVVCSNILGSCRGTTGPASTNPRTGRPYGLEFPVVTVADMVRAQRQFLQLLGIDQLLSIAGGSLGGMQGLEWTLSYPDKVRSCIMTASTAAIQTQGLAWNAIARNAIMADPAWQGGAYYDTGQVPAAGMGVARMVGHVTYLSDESIRSKFGRDLQQRDDLSYTVSAADFAVESYLRHQAEGFVKRFDPNSYLYISRALTYFDAARSHGDGSLERAMRKALAKFLLISFTSDWLYPPRDSQRLADALRANGRNAGYHNIDVPYGHDSFLLETDDQTPLISDFLARVYSGE
jgi:homoserine O-acetyltransferase